MVLRCEIISFSVTPKIFFNYLNYVYSIGKEAKPLFLEVHDAEVL
jgi:hypothetical protein